MNNLSLTVIMAVTNEENLDVSVKSYLNAGSAFKNVRILIADCIGDEASAVAIKKLLAENTGSISVMDFEALPSRAEVYSKGLSLTYDGYVCFTESAVNLNNKALRFVKKAIKKHPDCPVEISVKTRNKNENFIGYSKLDGLANFCDLNEVPYNAALAIFGYFFRAEDIKDIDFDFSIGEEALKKFILEALLKKPCISYSNKKTYKIQTIWNNLSFFINKSIHY